MGHFSDLMQLTYVTSTRAYTRRSYGRFMQPDPGDVSSRFLDAIRKTAARETTGDEVGLCTGYPFTPHTKRGLNKFDLTCEIPDESLNCANREFASGNGDLV